MPVSLKFNKFGRRQVGVELGLFRDATTGSRKCPLPGSDAWPTPPSTNWTRRFLRPPRDASPSRKSPTALLVGQFGDMMCRSTPQSHARNRNDLRRCRMLSPCRAACVARPSRTGRVFLQSCCELSSTGCRSRRCSSCDWPAGSRSAISFFDRPRQAEPGAPSDARPARGACTPAALGQTRPLSYSAIAESKDENNVVHQTHSKSRPSSIG